LAVAVGLYLPFELDSAIMFGGLIAWLISKYQKMHKVTDQSKYKKAVTDSNKTGLLFASGLITGEALLGIILAIPIAIVGSSNFMVVLNKPLSSFFGFIIIICISVLLYFVSVKVFKKSGK